MLSLGGAVFSTATAAASPSTFDSTGGESPSNWQQRPGALYLHGGLGTPLGFVGVQLEYNVWQHLGLAVGGGYSTDGPQGALEVAARPFVWRRHAIVVLPGVSVGRFDGRAIEMPGGEGPGSAVVKYRVELAVWFNGGVGYEFRRDSGFSLRAYMGYAVLLNPGDVRCYSSLAPLSPCEKRLVIPYFGAAVGRAF